MESFLEKFEDALTNGDYDEWTRFEQDRLIKMEIKDHFEVGETIDMIYEGIEEGSITFKPNINFNAFMKMQIRSMISKRMKRLTNNFDGYKDEETLNKYIISNGEATEEFINEVEEKYDLKKLEDICYNKILADDEEASLVLMEYTEGKQIKAIANDLDISENETYKALRRARYKLEKYLPDEFRQIKIN